MRTRTAFFELGLAALMGLQCGLPGCSHPTADRVERVEIPAPALAGSVLHNPSTVPALVFLPPRYATSERLFPVVYYLPGFTTDVTEYVDGTFDGFHLGRTLDRLVANGAIAEMVVVVVHGRNALGGSFYVNSPVTGRWEDYVLTDVIGFVESHYRVARDRSGRGVAGESVGGFGALHLAMRHPDVFGAVFALSPGLFAENGLEDFGFLSEPYVDAWLWQQDRMRAWPADRADGLFAAFAGELGAADGRFNARRLFGYAYGAAFTPDPGAGPPWVAFPFAREGGRIVADSLRLANYREGFGQLAAKVDSHQIALRSLRGIGIDIGRNDALKWVPQGARRFAELLLGVGVACRLTEHDGGHVDRLGDRIETEMLPFFSRIFASDADGGDEP